MTVHRIMGKFKVTSVKKSWRGGGRAILRPVTCAREESPAFHRYLPDGYVSLECATDEALAELRQGREYVFEVTPSDEYFAKLDE